MARVVTMPPPPMLATANQEPSGALSSVRTRAPNQPPTAAVDIATDNMVRNRNRVSKVRSCTQSRAASWKTAASRAKTIA